MKVRQVLGSNQSVWDRYRIEGAHPITQKRSAQKRFFLAFFLQVCPNRRYNDNPPIKQVVHIKQDPNPPIAERAQRARPHLCEHTYEGGTTHEKQFSIIRSISAQKFCAKTFCILVCVGLKVICRIVLLDMKIYHQKLCRHVRTWRRQTSPNPLPYEKNSNIVFSLNIRAIPSGVLSPL